MSRRRKKLAIVGGGAAGLAAAIAAGERARELGEQLEIAIYEGDDRVGRSILATGNGRCNFSNADICVDAYHNASFAGEVLRSLAFSFVTDASERYFKMVRDNGDVVHAFFYQHGLMWREEGGGRQYPQTNKASTVVDVLRASARQVGVREVCGCEVRAIELPYEVGKPYTLRMADRSLERADAVIVACGGRALHALEMDAFEMVEQRPMLGPLRVSGPYLHIVRELDNIRVRCSLSLVRRSEDDSRCEPNHVVEEKGELLFRKYGVSGICAFNLSRFARAGDLLLINFLDGRNHDDAAQFLFARRKLLSAQFANLTCADMVRGLLLPRVSDVVLEQAGLFPEHAFAKADVPALAQVLTAFELEVAGIGDESLCQVRRGGLDVSQFNPSTLEACEIAGLFAAGEALDVDGPCGGYNLHWAWASGLLSGRSAANSLVETGSQSDQTAGFEGGYR